MCVGRIEDAINADACGVDRIEISSALEVDGVTPSAGFVEAVLEQVQTPIVVLIRSRPGGFVYESCEIDAMVRDARHFAAMGVAGLAFGIMTDNGRLDIEAMGAIADSARTSRPGIDLVCHRVFDALPDQALALRELEQIGVQRVLTSGGAATALDGAETICRLQRDTTVELVPAGGVRASTIGRVVEIMKPRSVHGSFRQVEGCDTAGVRLDRGDLQRAIKSIDRD